MSKHMSFVVGSTARVLSTTAGASTQTLGGAGFNVAGSMQAVGTVPRLITTVGTDLTRSEMEAVRRLTSEPFLKVVPGRTSQFQFHHTPEEGAPRISSEYGVGVELTEHARSFNYYDTSLHVCCRSPLASAEVLAYALLHQPAFVSVDFIESSIVEHAARIVSYVPLIDLVFVNEREFEIVQPYLVHGRFRGDIVVTRGSNGACVLRDRQVIAEAMPVRAPDQIVDATGAGDALAGTFLAVLFQAGSLRDALARGVEAGTHSVTDAGIDAIIRRIPNA